MSITSNNDNVRASIKKIDEANEPHILIGDPNRLVILPIRYPEIWTMYKNAQASIWTMEEIDFGKDVTDWEKMTNDEQHFIKHTLGFFAASDTIVNYNLFERFATEVKILEATNFYAMQGHIECVHSETYATLIDIYVKDQDEKNMLFNAITTIPSVKKKADWALKWANSESATFGERLVAFVAVEGLLFSGSFASIFYMKKRGLLPGLTFSNELISRDEGMHTEFGIHLFKMLNKPPSRGTVYTIVGEAVDGEVEFMTEALPVSLIGMNVGMMKEYIEFVADYLLVDLGFPKKYNTKNPFDFMENISLQNKTNFFEARVGAYSKAGFVGQKKETLESRVFTLDEDF